MMDRRTLAALILSMLVLVGWQMFFMPKPEPTPAAQVAKTETTPVKPGETAVSASSVAPTAKQQPRKEEALDVAVGRVEVSNDAPIVDDWTLTRYKKTDHAQAVDLKSMTLQDAPLQMAFDSKELMYLANVRGEVTREGDAIVWKYSDDKIALERRITTPEGAHYVIVEAKAQFKTVQPKYAFLLASARATGEDSLDVDRKLVYFSEDELGEIPLADEIETANTAAPVAWAGVMDRYFTLVAIPQTETRPMAVIQPMADKAGRISMTFPVQGNTLTLPFKVYFGPKELGILKSVDPSLTETVNFGWLSFFANPLLQLMKWFFGFVHNWGVAIILLTLVVRLLTFPLTWKSMKNMQHMAKLQPQLKKIQEKYKDDREALNREMMVMMRTHGYNPLAGCLPILVQLPVFFALYRVLYSAVELYQTPFMLWITDLSEKDPYYITPVLLTGTMFLQQKFTPTTISDPVQAKVMQFMPILFGVMMINLPSGLTLYMLVSTVAGILQQFVLNKKLKINVAPEPARAR